MGCWRDLTILISLVVGVNWLNIFTVNCKGACGVLKKFVCIYACRLYPTDWIQRFLTILFMDDFFVWGGSRALLWRGDFHPQEGHHGDSNCYIGNRHRFFCNASSCTSWQMYVTIEIKNMSHEMEPAINYWPFPLPYLHWVLANKTLQI